MPLGFGEEASDGSFTHYNRGLEVGLEPWAHHPPGVANMCTWDVPWDSPCRDATKLLRIAETISCWDGGYDEILDELLDDEEAEAEAAAAEEEAEEAEGEEEAEEEGCAEGEVGSSRSSVAAMAICFCASFCARG